MNTNRPLLFVTLFALLLAACNSRSTPNLARTPALTPTVPYRQPSPKGVQIHEIQGAAHRSPLVNSDVRDVLGVVTAFRGDGFYLQTTQPDADPATSEGIFVFTNHVPRVKVGDLVAVSGRVDEDIPGGPGTENLAITRLINPDVQVRASNQPLPEPFEIGEGGQLPPENSIDSDGLKRFNPAEDAIDFFESLEGMLVQVDDAVVVGPTNAYGEVVVLAGAGQSSEVRTPRGGLVVQPGDFNPERLILDDSLRPIPPLAVGDRFAEPLLGIMDYSFGNYKLQLIQKPQAVSSELAEEIAMPANDDQLAIASYNVENLSATNPQARFEAIAQDIVRNLASPDILALQEIQDDDGPADSRTISAQTTLDRLIAAILAAGGPEYRTLQIDPEDGEDGGEPGANIRVALLYRADRGVSFSATPGGDARTPAGVNLRSGQLTLAPNPARIDPRNRAFLNSRKPLVAQFRYESQSLFVVVTHLSSKGGDQPLFGRYQPPRLESEGQRIHQAEVVQAFVNGLLAIDPNAWVVVLGDLNDFPFSPAVQTLAGDSLHNLILTLPVEEQYTYNFEGNAQALDQILVSSAAFTRLADIDIVHINSEWPEEVRVSDHDPVVARFRRFER